MSSLPSTWHHRHSGEHYYLLGPWWVSIARGTDCPVEALLLEKREAGNVYPIQAHTHALRSACVCLWQFWCTTCASIIHPDKQLFLQSSEWTLMGVFWGYPNQFVSSRVQPRKVQPFPATKSWEVYELRPLAALVYASALGMDRWVGPGEGAGEGAVNQFDLK